MNTPVITGVGTLGPTGAGLAPLRDALAEGRRAFTEVDRSAGFHHPGSARTAGFVGALDLTPWLSPAAARRMSRASRFAVVAARMACESAGLAPEHASGPDVAVTLATSFGATSFTERMLRQVFESGPQSASPFLFMETVANAHAGQIALALGAQGANTTITQREAGGLIALGHGADQVRRGAARVVLAGVVDEMGPLAHSVLDRFHALARPGVGGEESARPFDRDRDGFVAAEGATVFVLEDELAARQRDAPILARVGTCVRAFDPTASPTDWGRGEERLSAIAAGRLAAAGGPAAIDRVVSGASGSRSGDRLEALVLRGLWGPAPLPPILAPKAVTGEYGGGFLAAALLALGPDACAAPTGFRTTDPELGVGPYAGASLPRAERILVSSLASGGTAAWLVLERS